MRHTGQPGLAARVARIAMALAIGMAVGMTGACGSQPETPSTATNQPTASEEKSANGGKQSAEPSEQPTNSTTVVPLHIKGAKLLDEQNHPRQLRGVSTHGIAWFPQYVNAELFGNLKREWGINTVRLAMYTGEEGGYTTNGNKEELRKLVHQGVDAAIKQDLYVIVDWHTLSDNNPLTSVDEAKRFFDEMSHDYAGKPNVIYEICNEPNGGTTWAQVKQYAEQIIPVIRANDKNALILVGTPNWCQNIGEAEADPITGAGNLMYTMHFYAAEHHEELRNAMVSAVESGFPVFVSEFGLTQASGDGAIDTASAQAWLNAMDEHDISYVIWNLSNKNEGSALFVTGETRNPQTSDLSAEAKWYRDYLKQHATEANR